jgi:phage terminase Nu1 subunit (DNA packaging protein)
MPSTPKGTLVNRAELSKILGKNVSTIDAWVAKHMPVVERGGSGKEWSFNTTDVIAWREDQLRDELSRFKPADNIELEEARRRKLVAEAGLLELELNERVKQLIPREEIEQGLNHAFITIRQRLRTIPERIAPRLLGEEDERVARDILIDEIDDALLELSELDYSAPTTEQSS